MSGSELDQRISAVRVSFEKQLGTATSLEELEAVRVAFLGRKGAISDLFPALGALPPEERAAAGAALNALKQEAADDLDARRSALGQGGAAHTAEAVDVTLPGIYHTVGHPHLLSIVQREIEEIFLGMGFDIAVGPEIETEYHNFEALNIPAGHPAREDWDTFYISDSLLLRPHTSPVQIRVMEATQPPVRIICPGRCFRRDAQDATHSPTFFQVELLWIDEDLSLANLRYVIDQFVGAFFGPGYETRLSGDFFPFTEPSVQLHMRQPGEESWLEIGGAGMVDPAVLQCVGYDPEVVSGFAFGFGLERMAMLKHGIRDIRTFLANDLRFIRQFRPQ
jgi:phenylalanyl-tRNA synthetase alpha chain